MINFKDQTKRRFLENNRHCLLRHMPIEYQKLFFFGRHNLGNLFEQLEKLAFMGLITFENIQKRQKGQGFTDVLIDRRYVRCLWLNQPISGQGEIN